MKIKMEDVTEMVLLIAIGLFSGMFIHAGGEIGRIGKESGDVLIQAVGIEIMLFAAGCLFICYTVWFGLRKISHIIVGDSDE